MNQEKRRSPRGARMTEIVYTHEGLHFEGRLSDLSEGGFYIDTINPIPEGSIIAFRFVLVEKDGDSIIEGEGRVAWQRPFQGMGIAFTRLSDDVRDRLKAHFSRA